MRRKKGNCPAFGAAIRKYGFDKFQWKVLRDGLSEAEAKEAEIRLISEMCPAYNVSAGGDIGLGKTRRRAVICINTGVEFESGTAASEACGVSQMTVSLLCRNGGETKTGLRFRFADAKEVIRKPRDPADIEAGRRIRIQKLKARRHPPETIEKMRRAAKARGVSDATRKAANIARIRPVRCVETGQLFAHAEEAARSVGLKRGSIYALLYRPGKKCGAGLSFEFVR